MCRKGNKIELRCIFLLRRYFPYSKRFPISSIYALETLIFLVFFLLSADWFACQQLCHWTSAFAPRHRKSKQMHNNTNAAITTKRLCGVENRAKAKQKKYVNTQKTSQTSGRQAKTNSEWHWKVCLVARRRYTWNICLNIHHTRMCVCNGLPHIRLKYVIRLAKTCCKLSKSMLQP